jgi:lysozyme
MDMKRPNIDLNEVADYIAASGHTIVESVFVLAIRGYYKKSMGNPTANDRGIYDDAIVLVGPNYIQAFNANTDPSRYKTGIAKLIPGLHYFKRGKHGLSKGLGKAYDAFRPATVDESLPVTRDGQKGISKGIAINLHSGGDQYTNSAGCQTIFRPQWLEFQKTAYQLMGQEGQRELPYLLIEND